MPRISPINMKIPECLGDNDDQKVPSRWQRTLIIIAAVFCGMILVSGVTLAAVYVGSHITRNAFEGQVTLHTADGETIKEHIIVREAEVEITEPGKFSVINDYNKHLSMFKFDDGTGSRCYIARLNTTVVGTRGEMKSRIKAVDVFVPADTPTVEFVKSEIDVHAAAADLGVNARTMCEGLDLQWLTPASSGVAVRNKRCHGQRHPFKIEMMVSLIIKSPHECK